MTLVHFYLSHHTQGSTDISGVRMAQYLLREGGFAPTDASNMVDYAQRTGGRKKAYDDLRDKGYTNLPSWAADDPKRFFEAAYLYEGKNRRWATSMQANFPRAFTTEQQGTFMREFVATHLPGRPLLWVLHEPITQTDHQPQPHAHLLWSERLRPEGSPEAPPERMFKRPEAGGYPKYPFGQGDRQALYRLREAWCAAVNLTVDREGYGPESLMDPRSFHARGIHRRAVRAEVIETTDGKREVIPPHDERTPEDRVREQQMAVEWWARYQRVMGLTPDLDRTTALQIIAREVREPGARARERAQSPAPRQAASRTHTQGPVRKPDGVVIGNVRSKIYHVPGDPNFGDVQPRNQVRFATWQQAEDAGYRAAVNQQYGPGATKRLEQRIAALTSHTRQLQHEQRLHAMLTGSGQAYGDADTRRVAALLTRGTQLGLGADGEGPKRRRRQPWEEDEHARRGRDDGLGQRRANGRETGGYDW